jgi:hypothetical protein
MPPIDWLSHGRDRHPNLSADSIGSRMLAGIPGINRFRAI